MSINPTESSELVELLQRHGLWARKGLGQHFLISSRVVRLMAERVEGMAGILEVGPGPGSLTHALVGGARRVIALELDASMPALLAETAPEAEVRLGDVLQADLTGLLRELPEPRALVSNMPYNITGPLLGRIADSRGEFCRSVLMMQREVGKKIVAPVGDSERGSLSVNLQAQFAISKVCDVPRGAFRPPPKVESVVLELVPKASQSDDGDVAWSRFVRAGFGQPRKTLANNLRAVGWTSEQATLALAQAGLPPGIRPQMLTEGQWRALFELRPEAP